jgi:hypothetical protein
LPLAAENPEIGSFGMPDDRIFVIRTQIDNPVVTGKWPKEPDFELGAGPLVDNPCFSFGTSQLAVERFVTALVEHLDFAVLAERIGRHAGDTSLLKALRKAGNLIPCAHISFNFNFLNCLQWRWAIRDGSSQQPLDRKHQNPDSYSCAAHESLDNIRFSRCQQNATTLRPVTYNLRLATCDLAPGLLTAGNAIDLTANRNNELLTRLL